MDGRGHDPVTFQKKSSPFVVPLLIGGGSACPFLRQRKGLRCDVASETVEKVPKQILEGDAEKNDFTECVTINDLTIMKGRETPKNQALTILKGFSTVSPEVLKVGV
jgi:hypothetical protein